jgi:ADP-ribosylglycohydrolase
MSRIRNVVYGLALGDAVGFRVEGEPYERIVNGYVREDLRTVREKMWVSDDTTMSLYLLKAIEEAYDAQTEISEQMPALAESIATSFIAWYDNPDCLTGRGHACKTSLLALKEHLASNPEVIDMFYGSNDQSKGSGTIMRSPWLGILHAKGLLNDTELENLCTVQSLVTHRNLTAIHGSYLTARIVSALFTSSIKPGQIQEFAQNLCFEQEPDEGWDDLIDALQSIDNLPEDYATKSVTDFDPSSILGYGGSAHEVLAHAIAVVDYFGSDPVEVLRRSIFTGGDSDTIGAIAGAMVGASTDANAWDGIDDIIEDFFVDELDTTISYLKLVGNV